MQMVKSRLTSLVDGGFHAQMVVEPRHRRWFKIDLLNLWLMMLDEMFYPHDALSQIREHLRDLTRLSELAFI